MKQPGKNTYHFRKPPQLLLKAKLDNIAIVLASILPFKAVWQKLANNLPQGTVLIYHSRKNTRQRKILERIAEMFKGQGRPVTNLPIEQLA
jgi:hypothetical protein